MADACQTLGTSIIGICIGTRDPENMWRFHADKHTAEAWRDTTVCVREAVRMAGEAGLTLALEPGMCRVSSWKAGQMINSGACSP